MRIPYEGMIAAMANPAAPLLVSVWGNDFTLHAPATAQMGRLTRRTLQRATALHADCRRDIRLAHEWGFPQDRPYTVLPGGGGIQLDQFSPAEVPPAQPVVINPRGFRAYVRNDAFFQAIPLVLAEFPDARFLCPTMAGESQAQAWVAELGIGGRVDLLPSQNSPTNGGAIPASPGGCLSQHARWHAEHFIRSDGLWLLSGGGRSRIAARVDFARGERSVGRCRRSAGISRGDPGRAGAS